MGIETSPELGGAGCSFTSAILAIEGELRVSTPPAARPARLGGFLEYEDRKLTRSELAKVDPSVSVMCDVHNTLVR